MSSTGMTGEQCKDNGERAVSLWSYM